MIKNWPAPSLPFMNKPSKTIIVELDDRVIKLINDLPAIDLWDVMYLARSTLRPISTSISTPRESHKRWIAKLLWDARANATAGKDVETITSVDRKSLPEAANYRGLPCEIWTRAHWVRYFWEHGKRLTGGSLSGIDATSLSVDARPLPADFPVHGLHAATQHYDS